METATRRKRIGTQRTGDILVGRGVLTSAQLAQALAHQQTSGGLLGQVVTRLGFISQADIERELAFVLTEQYGVPYLSLEHYHIDPEVIQQIPVSVARQYGMIPVDRIGNTLSVAIADPAHLEALREVEAATPFTVQPFVSTFSEIQRPRT